MHIHETCVGCVYSQKLRLLRTSDIQTPIIHGSLVTEKLGLKMEIPSADLPEESSIRSRPEQLNSEWEYKKIVRIHRQLTN